MENLILIDGEFRSLIRNTLEKIIEPMVKKQDTDKKKLLLKVSTRVISSLIAIKLYEVFKNNVNIKTYTSYILVFVFIYLTI